MAEFGCGVSVMKLNMLDAQKSADAMNVEKACREFGSERASLTANVDPSRSHLNEYHFPEGCGDSGQALADWYVREFESYALEYGKTRKPNRDGSLKRPRAGTIVALMSVITPDENAVAQWDAALRAKFVRDSDAVYEAWLGRPVDAWAKHVDEGGIEERGLTRADALGNQGLHVHTGGRMPDRLPDHRLLVKSLGKEGAAKFRERFLERNRDDGCLYRAGTVLNSGRLTLLHTMFAAGMAERGWREPVDERDTEATGWVCKPHILRAERREREAAGEVFKPAGQPANRYARVARWDRKQRETAAQNAADAAQNAADAKQIETDRAAADERVADAEKKAKETLETAEKQAAEGFDRPKEVADYIAELPSDGLTDFERAYAAAQAATKGVENLRSDDPETVHVPGTRELDERRALLAQQQAALEKRRREQDEREREQDDREKRLRVATEGLDADIADRKAEVGRLDADIADRRAAIDGLAEEYERKREGYECNARRYAGEIRAEAVDVAKKTRERARADHERAQERVEGMLEVAGRRITRFLGDFAKQTLRVASTVLRVMRDEFAFGHAFDEAATVCIREIDELFDDPGSRELRGGVQRRISEVIEGDAILDVKGATEAAVQEFLRTHPYPRTQEPERAPKRPDGPEL